MPSIERPSGHTADGILEAACRARLDDGRRVRRWERAIYDIRLREELGVIQQLGLADYFLIVAEIADYAREHDIALVGRGSAVSSLVAHLLGVTAVDPIVHGLYFERFLHLGRLDPPDVDLDLPSDRRDEVIGWVFPSVRPRSRGDGVCPSDPVTTPGPFLVTGRVEDDSGDVHLVASGMLPFHARAHAYQHLGMI